MEETGKALWALDQIKQIRRKKRLSLSDQIRQGRRETGVSIGSDQAEQKGDGCVYWIRSGRAEGRRVCLLDQIRRSNRKTDGCVHWIGSGGADSRGLSLSDQVSQDQKETGLSLSDRSNQRAVSMK